LNFKNPFEGKCYSVIREALSSPDCALLDHNFVLSANQASSNPIVSFTGAPKKEIDVIAVDLSGNMSLLVSVKDYANAKVSPADVQEWGNVVYTMNEHTCSQDYLGIIVSSSGFSEGCAAWAMQNNVGLIPPFKGKQLSYDRTTILLMLRRVISVTVKLLSLPQQDLTNNRNFYWTVYKCVADFPEPAA
jgi:hypothetical protein